jgi:hypothetical protein
VALFTRERESREIAVSTALIFATPRGEAAKFSTWETRYHVEKKRERFARGEYIG